MEGMEGDSASYVTLHSDGSLNEDGFRSEGRSTVLSEDGRTDLVNRKKNSRTTTSAHCCNLFWRCFFSDSEESSSSELPPSSTYSSQSSSSSSASSSAIAAPLLADDTFETNVTPITSSAGEARCQRRTIAPSNRSPIDSKPRSMSRRGQRRSDSNVEGHSRSPSLSPTSSTALCPSDQYFRRSNGSYVGHGEDDSLSPSSSESDDDGGDEDLMMALRLSLAESRAGPQGVDSNGEGGPSSSPSSATFASMDEATKAWGESSADCAYKSSSETDECIICLDTFSPENPIMPTLCRCGANRSKFHYSCLLQWLEKQRANDPSRQMPKCPACESTLYFEEAPGGTLTASPRFATAVEIEGEALAPEARAIEKSTNSDTGEM